MDKENTIDKRERLDSLIMEAGILIGNIGYLALDIEEGVFEAGEIDIVEKQLEAMITQLDYLTIRIEDGIY